MPGENKPTRAALRRAERHIRANYRSNPTDNELASRDGLPVSALVEGFRREFGVTPREMIRALQVRDAAALLAKGMSVADVAAELGFADAPHLIREYRRATGVSPGRAVRVLIDGSKVKQRREKRGWNTVELGEAAGIRSQQIGKIERRSSNVRPATAMRLAKALHCTVDDLRATPPGHHKTRRRAA